MQTQAEYLESRESALRAAGELCPFPIHAAKTCLCVRETNHQGDHACKHGARTPQAK